MGQDVETAGSMAVAADGAAAPSAASSAGRIGPNAVTRIAEALATRHGEEVMRGVFADAALLHHLQKPPGSMLDERDVMALHRAGRRRLGEAAFAQVADLAGQLTGDYILAKRIPMLAQRLLKILPCWLASRVLGKAIAAHAWTFAGSGEFSLVSRPGGMLLTIKNSPLARAEQADVPLCGYYSATFERIFSRLVSPGTAVTEISCMATGANACCFDVVFG